MVFIKTTSQLEQYLISKRGSLFILIMGEFSSVSNPNIAKNSHTQNCSYCKLIKNRFKVNQGHPRLRISNNEYNYISL